MVSLQSMGMFMGWIRLFFCFLPFSLVFSVDVEMIHSIEELSEREFGKSFPQHGLLLLYWFASVISIDDTNVLRFKEDSYDPVTDFPFKHEKNLDDFPYITPTGQRAYYSAGDLEDYAACFMPSYVTQDFHNSDGYEGRNLDRLVIVIDKWYTPVRIDQVYIAKESDRNLTSGSVKHIYRVGLDLLRQITTLTGPLECQSSFLKEIFPHLGFNLTLAERMYSQVGLPLFVALSGYDLEERYNITARAWSCLTSRGHGGNKKSLCNTSRQELSIRTSQNGHAVIIWHGLPSSVLKVHTTVALFQANDHTGPLVEQRIDGQESGSIETTVPLDPGLQVRLIKQDVSDTTIWQGPILNDGTRQLPIQVGNTTGSMRLFARRGYAGVRLYFKKSFDTWQDDFYYSWVGFYSSPEDDNESYLSHQWQWVTRFNQHKLLSLLWHDVYEYVSGTAIAPGIQARFFLNDYNVVACTKAWDM